MIVGSILIAFGIDAGWDARTERIAERELLTTIRADMEANAGELARVMASHQLQDQLLDVFMKGSPASLAAMSVDSASQIVVRLPLPSTFTAFDGSLTSTDLTLIDDTSLRSLLGTWLGQAADVAEDAPLLIDSYRRLAEIASPAGAMRLEAEQMGWWADDTPSANVVLGRLRADMAYVDEALRFRFARGVDSEKLQRLQETTDSLLVVLPTR